MAKEDKEGKEGQEGKKKGSKLKIVLIVAVVLIVAIFALGSSGDDGSDGSGAGSSSSSSASTATVSTDEDTELVDFEEVTVVDNDYLTITLTDLDIGSSSIEVEVTLVNKDDSITYMVATDDDCSIDGVQVDPLFADEVAAGKTAYSTIYISDVDELVDAGVAITDIYLGFHAYDTDDWLADRVVDGEGVHLYPYGEDAATTFARTAADTDLVIVDNDEVTVTVIGFDPDYFWGYGIDLYVVNKTSSEVMMSVDDASINGVMCDPYWAASVGGGLVSFETLYWFSSTLEDDLGITDPEAEIEQIEFALDVYDTDTFDYYVDALTVTLEP